MTSYSVVIPTLNEKEFIVRCIRAILSGSETPDEIIVVDGNSSDGTREMALAAGAQVFLNLKVHAAGGRNIGLAKARGDVIVFTDADCVPAQDWLANIKRSFDHDPSLDGVGGPLMALPARSKVEAFWAHMFLHEIMPSPTQPQLITRCTLSGAFVTANCAYRKTLLLDLNGFDEWFGNQAEDVDLFWRAIHRKFKLLFLPSLVVYHSFPNTMSGMMKKNFRNGMSSSRLQRRYGTRVNIDKKLYRVFATNLWKLVTLKQDGFFGCAQVFSHLTGKVVGSLKFRVINL